MGFDLIHFGFINDASSRLFRRFVSLIRIESSRFLLLLHLEISAGLLKSINTVSLVTQIIGGASILSVMWHLFGFTLVYGHTLGGFIGNFDNILMLNVTYTDCSRHSPNIPAALFGFFEMMFAAISPLLITGAFAERLKYKAFILFIIGWEIFIYYPVAHWIWGEGWLGAKFEAQVRH